MIPIIHKIEIAIWKVLKKVVPIMENNGKVLVGVSGGPDSVALLLIINNLIARHKLNVDVIVTHFNHSQRGDESNEDASFVENLAKSLELKYISKSMKPSEKQNSSSEDTLRKERYQFFEETAKQEGAQIILLGHNYDDNIETVIMNFLRGTNLKGLAGMPERRGRRVMFEDGMRTVHFVRPMLNTSRAEITELLEAVGQSFRTDSSNVDTKFKRNWVRHELLPLLQNKFNAGLLRTIGQFREQMIVLNRYMDRKIAAQFNQVVSHVDDHSLNILIEPFKRKSPAIAQEIISRAVSRTRIPGVRDYRHISLIYSIIKSDKSDVVTTLKDNYIIVRTATTLRILQKEEYERERELEEKQIAEQKIREQEIPTQGMCFIEDFGTIRTQIVPFHDSFLRHFVKDKTDLEEFLDLDKIKPPLAIRFPKPDDMFLPLGQKKERRLSSFLKDCKIPHYMRDRTPILVDSEKIIWVIKHRLSDYVKFEEEVTRTTLWITFQEND